MINSNIKAIGKLNVVLRDSDGAIKEERNINNLVVSTGLNYIASRMKDASDTAMGYMAVGTGSTAAASGDTALGTEVDRNAFDSITVTNNTISYVASWAAGDGTAALTEAGIFNAASSGTMLARVVFATVNKGANDTLTITWTITLSAS
jgi:mannitol-specific phosphotransferase system IIBC component